jgi:hypothetical protein
MAFHGYAAIIVACIHWLPHHWHISVPLHRGLLLPGVVAIPEVRPFFLFSRAMYEEGRILASVQLLHVAL